MKIKMIKTAMVGRSAQRRNWVGPCDDEEAKGLIAAGYAKESNEANTDDAKPAAKKAAKSVDLAAILEGTVPEVADALAGLSVDELDALEKLEAKGKDRQGVYDAIASAAAAAG